MPLKIDVKGTEFFDNKTNEFITIKPQTLTLEHSLVSVAKWESKWMVPFISNETKTQEQTLDYIRCMTLTQNVNPNVYLALTKEDCDRIGEYIDSPMTATTFSNRKKSFVKKKITNEQIYYWMIVHNIPVEFQKWHLNRLLTLIRVCNEYSNPPKPMGKEELMRRNKELNAQRKKMLHTRG